ncbi:MAG: molybdenum cofactor synthesis domain protein, partial [Conexibacter sp.]|nr:molybdenum cofactor synthesis domain protein [Conexibacter sp.]
MSAALSVAAARQLVLAAALPLPSEPVAVEDALDRVLSDALAASDDVPRFDNSAMDGFAVAAGASSRVLRIAGESRAGAPASAPLHAGEAIRISTGAALPSAAEAVIRIEDTSEADGAVTLLDAVVAGQNVRRAGEDLRAGTVVLPAGTRLGPAELAVAVGAVTLLVAVVAGQNVRRTGEDLSAGTVVLPAGRRLGPAVLAVAVGA